ncbi:O-antigen ligase family protein [Cochlodiniinecator piscidefendens]|uniref:O-antigen ligase family protein n=1 Tax=Cochlodiniinecator piscidefendens TaxID=2715756 RepID=UPI00140DB9CB|nr:O-antigen ligase family protein [Cochlodiniinecator piscidefendens]
MLITLRHNLIALGLVIWLGIGSSARLDPLAGFFFLAFFLLLAQQYGARALSHTEVIGGLMIGGVVFFFGLQNPHEPLQIVMFLLELFTWMLIFKRPGNLSPVEIGIWVTVYAVSLLIWKVTLGGHGLFDREDMLINGPIKYAMICAIGYTFLLFRPRETKYPSMGEFAILALLMLAIFSALSRTPTAFACGMTLWFVLRRASLPQKILAGFAFAIAWGFLTQTRLFYVDQSGGNIAERVLAIRYLVWRDALLVIQTDPFFGAGGEIYRQTNVALVEYPHNLVLDLMLNTGLIGTFVFLVVLLSQLPRWTPFNLGLLAVSMTSGDIFLWIKTLFAPPPDSPDENEIQKEVE